MKKKRSNKEGLTNYPSIIYTLLDPDKRKKLESIVHCLSKRKLLGEVRYGVNGPTFDIVAEMLEVTG